MEKTRVILHQVENGKFIFTSMEVFGKNIGERRKEVVVVIGLWSGSAENLFKSRNKFGDW